MLILTRNIGETIVISNNIRVTVLSIRGNQIKIGIEAPKDILVNREEIHILGSKIVQKNGRSKNRSAI